VFLFVLPYPSAVLIGAGIYFMVRGVENA